MAYRSFFRWMFDGNLDSPLPSYVDARKGKILVSSNASPITQHFLVKLFINNGSLNQYFDKYLNNIYLWSIDKEELMFFVKECAYNFKIPRSSIPFLPRKQAKTKLFQALSRKLPLLKNFELDYLCDIVDKSPNKNAIYASLNLGKPAKTKITKRKRKKSKKSAGSMTFRDNSAMNLSEFIKRNFKIKEM